MVFESVGGSIHVFCNFFLNYLNFHTKSTGYVTVIVISWQILKSSTHILKFITRALVYLECKRCMKIVLWLFSPKKSIFTEKNIAKYVSDEILCTSSQLEFLKGAADWHQSRTHDKLLYIACWSIKKNLLYLTGIGVDSGNIVRCSHPCRSR